MCSTCIITCELGFNHEIFIINLYDEELNDEIAMMKPQQVLLMELELN